MARKEAQWQALVARRRKLKSIRGKPASGEPADEAEHFYICSFCGQAVDKRDLFAVLHHEAEGHESLPMN
jgi:hypothetical protein